MTHLTRGMTIARVELEGLVALRGSMEREVRHKRHLGTWTLELLVQEVLKSSDD